MTRQRMLVVLLEIILLLHLWPSHAIGSLINSVVPTPPPVIDRSGQMCERTQPTLSYQFQASWNPDPHKSGADFTGKFQAADLNPVILLNLHTVSIRQINVRIENTLDSSILLQYVDEFQHPGSLTIVGHSVSDPFFVSFRGSFWSNVICSQLKEDGTKQVLWRLASVRFDNPEPPPAGMSNFRFDFVMMKILSTTYSLQYRGERFVLVIADRRQHPDGTKFLPTPPASDLRFVDCVAGVDHACYLNLTFDPDLVNPERADRTKLTQLLWQYYGYDLRRVDVWNNLHPKTSIPTRFAYESLGPRYNTGQAARIPIVFTPFVGAIRYLPTSYESQYIKSEEDVQIPSDVCDPNLSPCATIYVHSGIRVHGVFSTAVADIHLCRFISVVADMTHYVLASVLSDGTALDCFFDRHTFHQLPGGGEVTLSSIAYFPSDRGYHTRDDEEVWESMAARDLAERVQRTSGDHDRLIEDPKMAAMARMRHSVGAHIGASIQHWFASWITHSSDDDAHQSVGDSTPTTSQLPPLGFTTPQHDHPQFESILKLLHRPTNVSSESGRSTPSIRRHHRSSRNASTTDPFAWQATDFTVPYGGLQVAPNTRLRLVVAHTPNSPNPFIYRARRDSPILYAITSNIGLVTFFLVAGCLGLTAGMAICAKLEEKCPAIANWSWFRPRGDASHEEDELREIWMRSLEEDLPDPHDHHAVRLIEIEHADHRLPRSSAASLQMHSFGDDDVWVWQFDFRMERRIERRLKRLQKELREVEQQHREHQPRSVASASSSSSSSLTRPLSTVSATRTTKRTPANELAVPFLEDANQSRSYNQAKEEELLHQDYQPPMWKDNRTNPTRHEENAL